MNTLKLLLIISFVAFFISCSDKNKQGIIEESGTIETTESVISSQVSGKVLQLLMDEGSQVKSGDTLVIIDHETLDLQLKENEASRDIAKSQLDLLVKGSRKEDIIQAEEVFNQATANFISARTDLERMEKLIKSNSVTQKQYDDAVSKFDVTQAQLKGAQENFTKIKNIARPEEIIQAKANYEKSSALVDAIKKSIRDCYVLSPINGFVVKKFIEIGETVSMMSSIVKVSDLSKVEVRIYVSETELGKVKLGQKAELSIDSFKDKSYEGKVTFISPEAEFTPKNIQTKDERTKLVFAVKVEIPNPNYELKVGLPADVKIYSE
jgi:HlyD family secretion protein